jgi:hypothetical protein
MVMRINLLLFERGLKRPQYLLALGDTILIVSCYPRLLAPNLQYYLPKSIIATNTSKKGLERLEPSTKDVFRASESAYS